MTGSPCPAHDGEASSERFRQEFLGGTPVEDYLIRELTDPGSPEFEGRSHDERSQRARSIALMVAMGARPQTPEEIEALRAWLKEGGES